MIVCGYCLKAEDEVPLMKCSACKVEFYCSKECQVKHREQHKPICRRAQQSKALACSTTVDSKRKYRLFTMWTEQAPLGSMLLDYYGYAQFQKILQQGERMIKLNVDFDYNKRTFVPTSAPKLVSFTEMSLTNPTLASRLPSTKYVAVLVCMPCKMTSTEIGASFLLQATNDAPSIRAHRGSWDDLVEQVFPFGGPSLKSSVFESWPPLQHQNMREQLDFVLKESPHAIHFIANALRIESTQARHKTHIVVIHVKLGLGLGQISKITDYQVQTVQEVKVRSQQLRHSPEAYAALDRELDLETHPELIKDRKDKNDLNICRVPILFDTEHCQILIPISFSVPEPRSQAYGVNDNVEGSNSVAVQLCDAVARRYFEKLTEISFPSVTSPELH